MKITFILAACVFLPSALLAQGRGPQTSKSIAPADLTGQWVSLITEDWRFRMVTPSEGDYASVPSSTVGRKLADNWDPAKDEAGGLQCKAYGAAGIMRMPTRVRASWTDDETLKIETDAGTQTRMLYFKEPKSKGGDWQGISQATWMIAGGRGSVPGGGNQGGAAPARPVGTLKVVTTKLRPGYLRRNGVPYSDQTTVTEYYDRADQPNGDVYMIVTTVVEDPLYLNQPFITSSHFKKETDLSKWSPSPCVAR